MLLFFLVSPAWAAAAGPTVTAELGFSGWIVPEAWVPLRVIIATDVALDGTVDVDVPNGPPGSSATTYRRAVQLPAGTRQALRMYVHIPDPRQPLAISVRGARGDTIVQQQIPIDRDHVAEGIVIALTADAVGLEFLATHARRLRGAYLKQESLPDHWAVYEGVELIVLRDLDERSVSGAQRQALRDWVAQGGRLLVTGERALRQHRDWLGEMLPAVSAGMMVVPADGLLSGLSGPLPVAILQPRTGAVVLPVRGQPLVASRPYGRGLVTAWAFDAFAPAVRIWAGRLALWEHMLGRRRVQPVVRRSIVEVIPTSRTLSGSAHAQIVVLSILYVFVIRGVLRRAAARRGGWIALGAAVLVFSVLLYTVSAAARRSAAATVQLSVLESTGVADVARVTTYVAVLLPYGGSYALSAPDGSLLRPLAPLPLVATAGNAAGGEAPPGTVFFEAVQVVSVPLRGRAAAADDGLELDIENRSGLGITAPVVYLNGQTQPVPEVSAHLTTVLPPGKWAPAERNAATGDFERDVRAWMHAHLDAYVAPAIIGYKTLWLLGGVHDARLPVQLHGASERREVQLLLSPIHVTGGR